MQNYKKVSKILLVGTKYHSYILSEIGFVNAKHNKNSENVYYYAESLEEAKSILKTSSVDLVQFDFSVDENLPNELSRFVKQISKNIATVLLTTRQAYYYNRTGKNQNFSKDIDYVFIWTGNSQLLRTIIRLVEDTYNREYLIKEKKLNTVLVVEDEPIFYSKFLPILYNELIGLAANVSGNSEISELEKYRPRVLLANTYEEADAFIKEYGEFVIGVLSDLNFPKEGKMSADSGLELIKLIKSYRENIPILVQSKDQNERSRVQEAGAYFLWKDSDLFLRKLRTFILNYFGFGDFIFRLPSGVELTRASNINELYSVISSVNKKSLLYHGKRHHFSSWLNIHGYPDIARRLYSISPESLSGEDIRRFLLRELSKVAEEKNKLSKKAEA